MRPQELVRRSPAASAVLGASSHVPIHSLSSDVMGSAKARGGSKTTKVKKKAVKRSAKLAEKERREADSKLDDESGASDVNTLFGKGKKKPAAAAKTTDDKPAKTIKKRPEPLREDPAAAALRAAKKQKKAEQQADAAATKKEAAPTKSGGLKAAPTAVKPHAEIVEKSNKLWERLRSEKTPDDERVKLVDEVLSLFNGPALLAVLHKHDAARVLQSCFKQGTPQQRDGLMKDIAGEARALARSHYGHFLLVSVLRHGTNGHKQQLLAELQPHAAELLVHAEGSAVLQLLYADVASASQRHEMFRSLWGKEIALLHNERSSGVGESDATKGPAPTGLGQLFGSDPMCKPRVVQRLEALLSKAARKGLALTSLVQRVGAELIEHGEPSTKAELVGALRDQAVHMMHTRDGASIACGCLRYGDAKDRKALLKALKGFAAKAAVDAHGSLVLCAALETVDDTVLLSKSLLSELLEDLPTLAGHPHGALPLLSLLAPRSKSYFTPEQISILGGEVASVTSKKEPHVRRAELLKTVLPKLLTQGAEHASTLARSNRGSAVLFETIRAASEAAESELSEDSGELTALFAALAAAAPEGSPALVADPIGARLLKRLAQGHAPFATELLQRLSGKLLKWAKAGGGWVVLALLESAATGEAVKAELGGSAAALTASGAAGCRSLGGVLAKMVPAGGEAAAAATVAGKKKKKAVAEEAAAPAAKKKKKAA